MHISSFFRIFRRNKAVYEIMMGNETDEIIEELCKSLLQKYQEGLEESMRGSEFIRDSNDLLYYHLQEISLERGGSCIVSPKWLKNKKATIDPKNIDDKCFQYASTIALNYQNIKSLYLIVNLLLISITVKR